jgi:hypothetical protein
MIDAGHCNEDRTLWNRLVFRILDRKTFLLDDRAEGTISAEDLIQLALLRIRSFCQGF